MSTVPFTFANNTGNIPLSELDTNFANVKLSVDYVIQPNQANIRAVGTLSSLSVSGNVLVGARVSAAGNIIAGNNLSIIGNVSASQNVEVAGNVLVTGVISASGNTIHGNILASGNVSAGGNITASNFITNGTVSALGSVITTGILANVVTAPLLDSANVSLTGNLIVAGNAQVNGTTTTINTQNLNVTDKNITIANGVSTSALIDGAGIDAGNPTVAYIRYSDASQGWTTANSFSVGTTLSVTGNATLSGNTALSGVSTAPTPGNSTANTQIATTAFVRNIIPTGLITMWYGSLASIPSGWFLCDGGNGTPDLRDRFIVGAGTTYAVNATGGSANAVVVAHTHTATSTDAGHTHTQNLGAASSPGLTTSATPVAGSSTTGTGFANITTTIASTGVSGTNANLPPYYALAFIMKA